MLLFLLVVVVVALVGGLWPALLAAVGGSLLLNYYFTPPLHTFTIRETNNALALVVFVVVAALVSSVVDLAARRTRQAARATAEAETLATLAGSVLRGETALPALLERVREAFGLHLGHPAGAEPPRRGRRRDRAAARPTRGPSWPSPAPTPCQRPQDADTEVPAGDTLMLALRGRPLRAEDQRVVGAFAAQAAVDPGTAPAQRGRRRRGAARRGRPDAHRAARRGRPRPAHPAGLGQGGGDQPAQRRRRVVRRRTATSCWPPPTSRSTGSTRLVDNLLDMSRLQAGALSVRQPPDRRSTRWCPLALDDLGADRAHGRRSTCPTTCPLVLADPALLERVVANLVANALRYSPPGRAAAGHRQRARRPGRAAGHRPRARASRRPTGTGSSRRSSGSATPTTPPASASGSPCPAG